MLQRKLMRQDVLDASQRLRYFVFRNQVGVYGFKNCVFLYGILSICDGVFDIQHGVFNILDGEFETCRESS